MNNYIKLFNDIINEKHEKEKALCIYSSLCGSDCPLFNKCFDDGRCILNHKQRFELIYNYLIEYKIQKIKEIL